MNVNRKELLAALTQATRVVDPKAHRPELRNVLLESVPPSKGGPLLRISTTDLETYFQTGIEMPGSGSLFRVLVNAKDARDLVKSLPGEEVAVGPAGDGQNGGQIGGMILTGEDPALFPELPDAPGESTFTVSGSDLKRMISEVSFAAARDDSRYALAGIMIERLQKENAVRLVATDGRRLAMTTLNYSIGVTLPEDAFQVTVPVKPLGYVRMALSKIDRVDVTVGTNYVQLSWGRTVMVLRQLESRFPEYAAVIPKDLPSWVYIDRKALIAALQSLKPFTSGNVSVVRFEVENDKMTLSAKDLNGEGSVDLVADLTGDSGATALNPQYLLEALKASDLPEVQLRFVDDSTPTRWDLGFTYVQMPISGTA